MKKDSVVIGYVSLTFSFIGLLCSCVSMPAYYEKHEEARAYKMQLDEVLAENVALKEAIGKCKTVATSDTKEKVDAEIESMRVGKRPQQVFK